MPYMPIQFEYLPNYPKCDDWCEYYGSDCAKDPQLPDYCPLYNPTTGKHYHKIS